MGWKKERGVERRRGVGGKRKAGREILRRAGGRVGGGRGEGGGPDGEEATPTNLNLT